MEEINTSRREKKPFAGKVGRIIVWFFVAMLALTYLSRAASDALRAKVSVGYVSSATLDQSVRGTGTWVSGDTQFYATYYARRITKVYVQPGQTVQEGDPLFAYDVSTVTGGKSVSDRKVAAAQKALDRAQEKWESASDADRADAKIVVQSAEQALQYARFTYAQTYALQNGGVVYATFSGVVLSCDLAVGRSTTAGVSGLEVALGAPQFSMQVSAKEAERISLGDSVQLYREGKQEGDPLKVASIAPPDQDGKIAVRCEDASGIARLIGAEQDWKIRKLSEQFDCCVPLEALRQGGENDYYVLVLVQTNTILGTQTEVKKIAVNLIARDDSNAAVDGELDGDDKLVTTSTRELEDGDLVVEHERG